MNIYSVSDIGELIRDNSYVGRGIVIGKSEHGKKAVFAYFIMGRSENSRNRIFKEEGDDLTIYPFDASKVEDPSLIIYSPVRKAGGSVIVSASLWKAPSYDFACTGSENADLQGYDLATTLGSSLTFTSQTAALVNAENIEIIRQNFGFDPANGVTQVALDLTAPRYCLEIRPNA